MKSFNNLSEIELAQPIWLYVYFLVAIVMLINKKFTIANLLQKIHIRNHYIHPYYSELKELILSDKKTQNSKYPTYNKISSIIIIGLLFLSLSGPYRNGKQLPPLPNNRDVLFIVDNEVSMVLKDYFIDGKRVERLTMVKSVLLNFTQNLSGNRIGIIAFSEQAHTLLPLTTDTSLIKKMIPRLESTLTGRTSNPQNALIYTMNYLHNLRKDNKDGDSEKPILVLITDVLRPPRDINPNIVAQYIKEKGFKLFVVAIGASTYKKSDVENSTLIYHPASFERLKEIAKYSDGYFYWAKNTRSLNGIIKEILKTKKTKIVTEKKYENIPLFHWPLGIALVFIFFTYAFGSLSNRLENV